MSKKQQQTSLENDDALKFYMLAHIEAVDSDGPRSWLRGNVLYGAVMGGSSHPKFINRQHCRRLLLDLIAGGWINEFAGRATTEPRLDFIGFRLSEIARRFIAIASGPAVAMAVATADVNQIKLGRKRGDVKKHRISREK